MEVEGRVKVTEEELEVQDFLAQRIKEAAAAV